MQNHTQHGRKLWEKSWRENQMRSRNIKPGFFTNEILSEIPPITRLLFIGLWCYADKEGKFEWKPKKIKAIIFPYDNCDVEDMLICLHKNNFIKKYNVNGNQYGFIIKFREHQNPHPHEAKSKIPNPEEDLEGETECNYIQCNEREMSTKCTADSLIPDSLIPDSLIPDS